MQKNKVDLCFIVYDFNDISHDDITNILGIQPAKIGKKGDKRNPKNPNSPLIKQNSWMMDSGLDEGASFEDQMNRICEMMETRTKAFEEICSRYYCEFSCAVFTYKGNGESAPWIHLDKRYHKLASRLNFEFDIDLYAF